MTSHSFDARIVNGQLVPSEALRAFEGRQVHVTLSPPSATKAAEDGSAAADDFDVEKDVYVRMPFEKQTLVATVVAGPGLRPCLILPEDLPDA